jgi:SNF2 family DNA or RNA helicase
VLVDSHIPADLWAALLPHQQAGVLAGVRRGGRLLLADDMGLGKTAQVRLSSAGKIISEKKKTSDTWRSSLLAFGEKE